MSEWKKARVSIIECSEFKDSGNLTSEIDRFIDRLESRDFTSANKSYRKIVGSGLTKRATELLRETVNPLIASDEHELTSHGVFRSFRFWSYEEKNSYLQMAERLVDEIRNSVTKNVFLGYGTALGIERDFDLIPHDDDIDIVAVLRKDEFHNFSNGSRHIIDSVSVDDMKFSIVEPHLIHVWSNGKKVDIFVGLDEDGYLASYPGKRGTISIIDIFPTNNIELYGVSLVVPGDSHTYLSKVYGPNWKSPDPGFSHNWSKADYEDLF